VDEHIKYALQASLLILSSAIVSSAQVPQVPHVLIVLEENTDYADVCGPNNTSMPFLCGLKSKGSFSDNYFAPTHPSIGNYTDLGWGVVSTNDDNCNPDTCGFPYTANNIVRAAAAAGKTSKGYAESLPTNCYFGGDNGNYAVHHSPIPYISDVQSSCQDRYVAFEDSRLGFVHDVASNTLPNFSFITPNLCNDGHDCGLDVADNWLQNNVLQPLMNGGHLDATTGDTVVIVVFDESGGDNTHGGGKVYWFMMGKGVKQNYKSTGPSAAPGFYSHESSLRVIAELVGASITGLGGAATAPDMAEFFGATTSSPPPVAVLTVLPRTGTAPLQVTADSSASSDPNGGIVSRIIDFGDGTTSTAVTAPHTYNTAGTFTVTLSVTDDLHLTSTASDTVTVQSAPQPISVSVSPTSAIVSSGGTLQFAATLTNTTNQAVTWTATAGAISGAGLFTAPVVSINTTITVTATSVADPSNAASAMVTVQPSAPVISVAVSPTLTSVSSGGTRQFTATVANTTNQAVTWAATAGAISSAGLLTAPVVSTNTTITVIATSVADPSKKGSATVTVQAPGIPISVQTVQHSSGFTGSANSVAVTLKGIVTAGNRLLVAQSTFDGETLNAPVDSQGNVFNLLVTGHSPGAAVAAIYIATANSTGPDTVTCSIGGDASDNIHCHVYEVSGTTSVVDALGTATQIATSVSVSTSNPTTNANDYIFAYFSDDVSESTYVAGSGLGNIEQTESPSQDSAFSGDKSVTTTGIQTATATTSTADTFVGLIVALKNSQAVVTPTAPSCTLVVSPASGRVPLVVNASATCTDPQNSLISTVITWGDDSSTNGSSGSHTYVSAGSFAVQVAATNSSNLTGSDTQTVVATSSLPPPPVSVTISPTSATISSGGTQQFAVTIANSTNQAVTWTATAGTISSTGLFTAPKVSTNTTITVTVSSMADTSQSASATVQVVRRHRHDDDLGQNR
jgi:PKD repeat protein